MPAQKSAISHAELCKRTAEWTVNVKRCDVAMIEAQLGYVREFPDVLAFKASYSTLYEIKVSRSDFLSDKKKDCRAHLRDYKITFKPKYLKRYDYASNDRNRHYIAFKEIQAGYTEVIRQAPHLGARRYYVTPFGMVQPEEVELFGLIWYREKDGKFFLKKESSQFRRNMYAENELLCLGMRSIANKGKAKILTKAYKW